MLYLPMQGEQPLGPPMSRSAATSVLYATVRDWRERTRSETGYFSAPKDYRRRPDGTRDLRYPEWMLRRNGNNVARLYLKEISS